MRPRKCQSRVPRARYHSKATAIACDMGEDEIAPGGVYDHGTREEDDPGTWEAHVSPRETTGATETR